MTWRSSAAWLLVATLGFLQFLMMLLFAQSLLQGGGAPALAQMLRQITHMPTALAIGASVASAVLLGAPSALALWRLRSFGLMAGFLLAPLLVPIAWLAMDGSAGVIVMLAAHASLGLATGTVCGMISLAGIDLGVLRAAACCGVSPSGVVRRVMLPMMAPGILASALLATLLTVAMALTKHGTAIAATLPMAGTSWLAAAGIAVLVCALSGLTLLLVRRA